MADVNAKFNYEADFSSAISQARLLSRELGVLNSTFNSLDKDARKIRNTFAETFRADIADIGGFSTKMVDITSSVDSFGKALDKNKLKLREYGREARKAFQANSNARKLAEDQVRRTKADLVELGMDANGRRKGILVTPMRLDMSDMQTQLEVARKQFSIFNKLVNDGATQLINWGKNTQWAGRQLTVGLTVPMTIFAATTIKAFNDVDKELTRFQKVYGSDLVQSVNQNTNIIRQQVQALAVDIAKSYGIAAKETAGLAADLAATGLEGQKLLDSVKQTTRLAVLGEIDRQDAMKTTLSLQNAFNMSTKELSESINFLNAVENQTSVSLQDLTEAIPKVGPVVRALGGDVKDLSVLLVAMKEGGINAAEGANALKSGLASLINPTKSASEVAKSYGIDLENIVKKNKGQLLPTVLEFQASMQTLDELGKAKIIEQLFGKYQFARISALFDNLNAQGSQTQEVIKLMGASSKELATIANQEIKTLTESASMRFQRAMEGIKASLLPVGETIVRSVLPFMEKLSTVFDKIVGFAQNLPGPVKSFLKVVTGITAIAGPLIMMTGVLGNFLGYIIKGAMAFVNLGRKIKGLPTEKFELMDDAQIAAAKATDLVTLSIDRQKSAMVNLNKVMIDYYNLINKQAAKTPQLFTEPTLSVAPQKTESSRVKRINFIKRQKGGSAWVPGSGSGDKIPALLEPGEFVINRNAAKQYGGVLEDMNNGVPRFQSGGKIRGYRLGRTELASQQERDRASRLQELLEDSNDSTTTESRRRPVTGADSKTWNPKFIFGLSKGENEFINDLGFGKPNGSRKPEYINLRDRVLSEIASMDIDPRQKSFIIKNLNGGISPADLSSQLILAQALDSLENSPEMRAITSSTMKARIAATRILPKLRARDVKSFGEVDPGLDVKSGRRAQPWGERGSRARSSSYASAFDQFDISSRLPAGAIEEARKLGLSDDLAKIYLGSSLDDPSIRGRGTRSSAHGARFAQFGRIRMIRRQNGGPIKAIRGVKMPESYATKLAKIRQSMTSANAEASVSKLPISELGTKQSKIGGFSSAIPGVNGIYEINGQRYVVKGHDTLDSARAEANMSRITREVFGLETPNQEVVKIKHPETGELMFAVRSPYNEIFTKTSGSFSGDSIFDQIIASAVRRDKDLQPDNLWDNIVADVGQAGIMDKASQPRRKTGPQNSVLEQLAVNLGMVKGGARSHGAEAWNRATSSLTDEQIASGIKRAAQNAKSKVSTASMSSDFAYISKDLDQLINADLLPYIAHLRTVMPKEKPVPTKAAIERKALRKKLDAFEREEALAAGYPEWALQSGGILKRAFGGSIPRKNVLSPINNKPFIGPLNYADYRGTDPKYPGSQFLFDKPGDLEDWVKAPNMVPVFYGRMGKKGETPDEYRYSKPHWSSPQRMGSPNVLNYNDPKQEAFAKWIEGNQTAFRQDRRGSISIAGYDKHRETILDQMSDLPRVSLSRATVLDSTKPMPEFTRSPIEPLMSTLMGKFPLSQIIGQKINWTDLQSFSTKADASTYGKFVSGRFQNGLRKSQEVINRKVEAGQMMPVLFRFLNAKGQKGFNISQEAKVQNVWGKRVDEEEFILNKPSGTIDSIAQDIATKMYIVNLKKQGGAIKLQNGGAPWVPGSGEGDRVPALLEPGEFVVNKKAAKKFGGVLEDMNWNIAPRFQRGTPGMMPGMGAGAVSGGLMAMSMATSMMLPVNNFTDALNKSIMALSAFTGILSAMQMLGGRMGSGIGGKLSGIMTPKSGTRAADLAQRGVESGKIGRIQMSGAGTAASRRGMAAGASRFGQGASLLGRGMLLRGAASSVALLTNPIGLAILATTALVAATVAYKKSLDSAKKSATQTFKVSKAEAEAYGVELKNINDVIKENQEYTKSIGAQAISYAGTVSTGMDPEKEKAILEANKDLTKRLRNLGETSLGTTLSFGGDRSNQASALLSAKYASLLQQGFDPVASNEIVKALAKEAGVLDKYTEAAKRFGSIRLEDPASLIRAQIEGLKTFESTSPFSGEKGGFSESIKAIVDQVNLLAPQDQYEGLKELLTQIETLDTSKLEVAVRTLTQSAIDTYGRGSALSQVLQSVENRTQGSRQLIDPTSWNNASDINAEASAQLAASLQAAYQTGVITDEQLIKYKARIEEDDANEETYSDIMVELDNATKKRDVLIEANIQFNKTISEEIEKKNKEIIVEQNKLQSALEAKDEVIKNEERVFQENQKAGQKFVKAKQEEVEAINKGTDKYISSLEKRANAEDFYQNQQKTALGGLSALASGDIFGFLESQQQIAQNAAQFGYDQEISKIDEKRKTAVDALQSEMDAKQKALELEAEGHDARMQQLSDEREELAKNGAKAIANLQMYSDALSGIQGNQDVTKWLGSMTDLQAQAANKMAIVNYLIANPQSTIQEAYKAVLAQSQVIADTPLATKVERVTNKLKGMEYSSGGYVSGPGTGTSDSIPARLSNGEYVIKASAVDQYGHGLLNAINEQKFADGGPVDDYEKTTYSGKTFNKRTVRMLQQAEGLYGSRFGIYQGSYSTKIAASKGTHDGGGAVDIKPPSNINSALKALQKAGFWAKWRGSMNPPHIHAIAIGDKELSPQAKRQLGLPSDGSFNENTVESGIAPVVAGTTSRTVAQAISEMVTAGLGTATELNNLVSMGAGAAYVPFNRRMFGGSMTMNKPYLVGENGPEVVLPYGSGSRVSPKFSVPTGTNGIMVNTMPTTRDINILIDGSRSPQEVASYVISEIRKEDSRRSFGRGI